MTQAIDGFCHAKRGLLNLRDCGKHALSACASCGTGLCEDHQILTGDGVFCPDCAARDERFNDLDDERLERARYRVGSGYQDESYYVSPIIAAESGAFTEEDFGTFETQPGDGADSAQAVAGAMIAEGEGDDESSDSDDLDGFMES
jgi:hypothetical protein